MAEHLKVYQRTLNDGRTAQALIWHVLGDVGQYSQRQAGHLPRQGAFSEVLAFRAYASTQAP